jgi:MoaA/NifB/PqqE/SkfB family radical SAM enzyme
LIIEEKQERRYGMKVDRSLGVFFGDALRVSLRHPKQAWFFGRTIWWQWRAAWRRAGWRKGGLMVPPIILWSVTDRCNLHCKGCYHQELHRSGKAELSADQMARVLGEARELGISFMGLAGGEPLMRREVGPLLQANRDIIFLVFTNGLLLDEEWRRNIKQWRNVVPVISLEGYAADTDGRRGVGVYENLHRTVAQLREAGIFFGVSLTVSRGNCDLLTDERFISDMVRQSCKLFFFVEYSPVSRGTEDWVITPEQRIALVSRVHGFRHKHPSLFIAVPGDEEEFGGCLAAGRGFIHLSAQGDVEPCPFVPYSDSNLKEKSLKEALRSPFLAAVRQNEAARQEGPGGCSLWDKKEWLQSLLSGQPADKT